jgi:hypothetical protein
MNIFINEQDENVEVQQNKLTALIAALLALILP